MVKTQTVSFGQVANALDLPAKVQANPAAVIRVFPPASGRVLNILVRPGDRVAKGQVIAVLESSDVSSARSDYVKAKIEADRTGRELRRATLLHDHNVMSDRDFLQAQADAASAKSEMLRTEDRLRVLGLDVNGTSNEVHLKSPVSGAVLSVTAAPGEFSKSLDNATELVTLADLSQVWVLGDVFEKDLSAIKVGDHVTVRVNAYPDQTWQGRIANIGDAIDPTTRTVKVRIVLPNPQHLLKPEMFATIHVEQPATRVALLPAAAVLRDGEQAYVFIDKGSGKYERRDVQLEHTQGQQIEIASGLQGGESVVVQGANLLRGGEQE